jgi:hypothetical protein
MCRSCIKLVSLMFALVACADAGASADSPTLSGRMTWWQQLVGSWSCDVTILPDAGQRPERGVMFAKGSVAPYNVFHWRLVASGIEADQYDGYSDSKKLWWETQAASSGTAVVLRSSDGLVYDQVSEPPSLEEDGERPYHEVYSIRSDGTFSQMIQRRIRGSWRTDSTASCKRQLSPMASSASVVFPPA